MKTDSSNGDYYEITVVDKATGDETRFVAISSKNDYEVLNQYYDNVQLTGQDGGFSNTNSSNYIVNLKGPELLGVDERAHAL